MFGVVIRVVVVWFRSYFGVFLGVIGCPGFVLDLY